MRDPCVLPGDIMAMLLNHGGSVGWGAEYEVLLADAIKVLYRMKKTRERFGKLGVITSDVRGKTNEGWKKLRGLVRRMHRIRKERRSPLTEAFYNGNHEVR